MKKPLKATHFHNGSFYKVGVHGLVFRWNGDQWIKSSMHPSELQGSI